MDPLFDAVVKHLLLLGFHREYAVKDKAILFRSHTKTGGSKRNCLLVVSERDNDLSPRLDL
jgi:hypothetical protein